MTVLTACGKVSGTGRTQILLTSQAEERQQGIAAYDQILSQSTISKDPKINMIVQRVGKRLVATLPKEVAQEAWTFTVIVDSSANAFALPGGKVAIHTGILPFCKDEAGLAAVMGHEIAHVVARHGGERMSQQMMAGMAQQGLAVALEMNGVEPTEQALYMSAFGLGSQLGVLLPYSRKHESEADYLGMLYMAEAGYNPNAAVTFWQRFASAGGGTPEFLSTHPHSGTRSADLNAAMPEARLLYERAQQKHGFGVRLPVGQAVQAIESEHLVYAHQCCGGAHSSRLEAYAVLLGMTP